MSQTLRKALPPIYGPLFSEQFDQPAIVESRATCENCQMCDRGTMPEDVSAVYFRPDVKCCTYRPSLPNYLIGAILADDRPEAAEGQKRVRAQIAARIGVTPGWVGASNKWELLYSASSGTSFGRSLALKCPYFDEEGRCSIWRHREAVCMTFFCKFAGGAAGSMFWKSMKAYLCHVEDALATWAMKAVSPEIIEPQSSGGRLTQEELEDLPPKEALYKTWWQSWVGREAEFYIACHEKVKTLDRAAYAKLVDETPRGTVLLRELYERYGQIGKDKIPERMALNPKMRSLPVTNGRVVTTPYNPYDSMFMESELYSILSRFKFETPTAEMREQLAKDDGIEFEDALLRELAVHGILIAPTPGWEAGTCEAPAEPVKLQTARRKK